MLPSEMSTANIKDVCTEDEYLKLHGVYLM